MASSDSSDTDEFKIGPYRIGYGRLLGLTTVLIALTILLGVATKATGSGLACDANWPLCDGGIFNLFPATFPSVFEWIHRVVAFVAGIAIVVTAIAIWLSRAFSSHSRYAVVIGAVLTPVQVYLGRETVLSYDISILSLHFWVALLIFTIFLVVTIRSITPQLSGRSTLLLSLLAAALVPIHVSLSPIVITAYTPVIQTLQYAVVLGLITAIALLVLARTEPPRSRAIGFPIVAAVLAVVLVFLSRRAVMTFSPRLNLLYLLTGLLLVLVLIGFAVDSRIGPTGWADRTT